MDGHSLHTALAGGPGLEEGRGECPVGTECRLGKKTAVTVTHMNGVVLRTVSRSNSKASLSYTLPE